MGSENEILSSDCIAEMVTVIKRLWDEGFLFPGPAEDVASTTYRRWHTFERRHKKHKNPQLEDRQRDLVKGLQSQFEPTGMYVRVEEWEGLVRALAQILDAPVA